MTAGSAGTDWTDLYRSEDTAAGYERRFRGWRGRCNNALVWHATAAELRRLAGGAWPAQVVDVPAGTGRFTRELRAAGVAVLHLDLSLAMLARLRRRHGAYREVLGDLRQPPLRAVPDAVALCLRLMQHLDRSERVAALAGLRLVAPRALVAYYPGWHYKDCLRRLRHRLGLPHRTLHPCMSRAALAAEAKDAGWHLARVRRVLPLFSEYVLLSLIAA